MLLHSQIGGGYKEEVREAIPYNAAILLKSGVNTAINSDDAEMARRPIS